MECVAAIRAGRQRGRRAAADVARVAYSGGGLYALRRLDTGRGCLVRRHVCAGAKARYVAEGCSRFIVFTVLVIAGPLGWLAYNQHFFHDPLDFMRGPYSAAAIEKKTSPPGSEHYHGWHSPFWALVYYTRTAQVDAAFWETGFLVMAAAIGGLVIAIRRRLALPALAALDAAAVLCLLGCVWFGADLYSAAVAALVLQLALWDGDAAGACSVWHDCGGVA